MRGWATCGASRTRRRSRPMPDWCRRSGKVAGCRESLPERGGRAAAGDRAADPRHAGTAEDRGRRPGPPSPADRVLPPARRDDVRGRAVGDNDAGRLSLGPDADRLASKAAATAGREGQGPDRIGSWLPLGSPSIDWSVPSPAWQPVPAHPREAEHAWKDGDSWRRGGPHQATGDVSTLDCFGPAEDRTGVGSGLRAIMEAPIRARSLRLRNLRSQTLAPPARPHLPTPRLPSGALYSHPIAAALGRESLRDA